MDATQRQLEEWAAQDDAAERVRREEIVASAKRELAPYVAEAKRELAALRALEAECVQFIADKVKVRSTLPPAVRIQLDPMLLAMRETLGLGARVPMESAARQLERVIAQAEDVTYERLSDQNKWNNVVFQTRQDLRRGSFAQTLRETKGQIEKLLSEFTAARKARQELGLEAPAATEVRLIPPPEPPTPIAVEHGDPPAPWRSP